MTQNAKKVGYLTVIVMTVATTIGAGIFFKNGELFRLGQGSLVWVVSTWLLAGFGIIALGLSLIELTTVQTTNSGIFEWTKKFVGGFFHKVSISYNKYIFVPITLFTMPIYFTQSFEDIGVNLPGGWAVGLLAFGVMLWFMFFNLLSIRITSKFQWFTTIIKFIPLIVLPIIAFTYSSQLTGDAGSQAGTVTGINGIHPSMILVAGIPAITFAYDGFQAVPSIRQEMKNPKRIGSAIFIGLIIITAAYLFVTIGFGIGSTSGDVDGITWLTNNPKVKKFFSSIIAIGILGIVNGVIIGFVNQLAAQTKNDGEARQINWIAFKIFKKDSEELTKRQRFLSAWVYTLIITTMYYLVVIPIGTWVFKVADYSSYAATSNTLYTLTDFLVNFTSLIIMLIIVTAVAGAVRNRKTRKIAVEKQKFFLVWAWSSIIIFYSTGAWFFIAAFIDLSGINGADWQSALIKVSVLIAMVLLSIIPALWMKYKGSKIKPTSVKLIK